MHTDIALLVSESGVMAADLYKCAKTAAGARVTALSLAIVGSGGAGAITAGNLLLEAAAGAGWYGVAGRAVGPQIRGGETAALLRIGVQPMHGSWECFDILVALDWENAERFAADVPLTAQSLVIADSDSGDVPAFVAESGAAVCRLPIGKLAAAIPNGRNNLIAVGILAEVSALPERSLHEALARQFAGKDPSILDGSLSAIAAGRAAAAVLERRPLAATAFTVRQRWLLTGNEAAALGAIRAGVRFVAAYPITPATDLMEALAAMLPEVGGCLIQAEDELASINMIIGASFGGVPALTATSGPGLALMIEGLGLAVSAEIPLVVVDVMRGGPSTGIPTRSEQSDLNIALYGMHGDAPHLVLAPLGVGDCLLATQWSVFLAEALQAPAIVLSDQYLAQARTIIDAPDHADMRAQRQTAAEPGPAYRRYAPTDSGVSPMAIPGTPGGEYVADGLEHDMKGVPSSRAADHAAQLDKRRRKLENFDYGDHWAECSGRGSLAVVTWGSATGAVREALDRLAADGIDDIRLLAIRLLSPPQPARFAAALSGVGRVLVVEQSHGGQFYHYLRAHFPLPDEVRTLHRPGPVPIRPGDIEAQIRDWRQA
jgi:2-oxoglutarate ferredoxin oxidoreductase subunit alpha